MLIGPFFIEGDIASIIIIIIIIHFIWRRLSSHPRSPYSKTIEDKSMKDKNNIETEKSNIHTRQYQYATFYGHY